jgi:hypothetical protein
MFKLSRLAWKKFNPFRADDTDLTSNIPSRTNTTSLYVGMAGRGNWLLHTRICIACNTPGEVFDTYFSGIGF